MATHVFDTQTLLQDSCWQAMMATSNKSKKARGSVQGKLRIGDDWNAISIIALSQSNPLKAVAEFVENSIDAGARHVRIIRGRQQGQPYLKIIDDGDGLPRDEQGLPNFKYVATHICDSIKRQLKAKGKQGVQGEFGIGLLSFWTVGETLSLISTDSDGRSHEMQMAKGDPTYAVGRLRRLVAEPGVELTISPLLPGIRGLSGEKLQSYLAAELRDRIRTSGVDIVIVDRQARAEYRVVPRAFSGQLLHNLPALATPFGEAHVELYLADAGADRCVALYRSGTRVLESVAELESMQRFPWQDNYLQGAIDAPFLNLSPGTRLGVIHDDRLEALLQALPSLEDELENIIEQQQKAAEEQANQNTLQSIQRAFREAMLSLPEEDYDWFDIRKTGGGRNRSSASQYGQSLAEIDEGAFADETPPQAAERTEQQEFFEHAGPLYSVRISPAATTLGVGKQKSFRLVIRDRAGRQVDADLTTTWQIAEGAGEIADSSSEIVSYTAPPEPQLVRLQVCVRQANHEVSAEALITVTESLLPEFPKTGVQRGLPAYTFEKHPGELWRSRYDEEKNLVVVNNGHRDFVYASRSKAMKLRYVCRLFAKELVQHNFPGCSADHLLERMIELLLYTEENLRQLEPSGWVHLTSCGGNRFR